MQQLTKPVLIFTWGNPSRGDDALGTQVYDLLLKEKPDDVEVLTDFQLQIEHTVDLERRNCILFVDASVSANAPFEFYPLTAAEDDSYTTHAMSPASLLSVYEKVNRQTPPPCYLLSIRGYEFGLGLPLSDKAAIHLTAAISFIRQLLETNCSEWLKLTNDDEYHADAS